MNYDTYDLSLREKGIFLCAGWLALGLLLWLFYQSLPLSLAGGSLIFLFLPRYEAYLCERRKQALLLQFKDCLYFLSAALAAGHSMGLALQEAEGDLTLLYGEKAPLPLELARMNRAIRDHRENEASLLLDLGRRSGLEDILNFAEIYELCRELGGDTEEIIRDSSRIITEKINIMREIKTLTAQKQWEGRLIAGMPILVLAGLETFYPDYITVFFTTLAGRLLMTCALAGIGTAFLLLKKYTDITP